MAELTIVIEPIEIENCAEVEFVWPLNLSLMIFETSVANTSVTLAPCKTSLLLLFFVCLIVENAHHQAKLVLWLLDSVVEDLLLWLQFMMVMFFRRYSCFTVEIGFKILSIYPHCYNIYFHLSACTSFSLQDILSTFMYLVFFL